MKCWVEGSECLMHSGDNYEFGLLNVTESFCQGCFLIRVNQEIIGEMIKRFQIEFGALNEEEQETLYEGLEIILEALKVLEKKQKKKIIKATKANKEEREENLNNRLKDIKRFKKFLKKLEDKLEDTVG